MIKALAEYAKQERIKLGLSYADLAGKMGYKNIAKGANKIIIFEREAIIKPVVLRTLVKALSLDKSAIESLFRKGIAEHEKQFESWVNQPVKMHYVMRVMPTIYLRFELPSYIETESQAVDFVKDEVRQKGFAAWLVISRREKIYITEEGEIRGKIETKPYNVGLPYIEVL